MRTIVVGDIHGCYKALAGLIGIFKHRADCQIVFLGDYVDRGPDSRGVIDSLIELRHSLPIVCLLGNHELMFRGVLNGLNPTIWLQHGGRATLNSYGGTLDRIPAEHMEFFDLCLPYYETEQQMFVHANYVADLPLEHQPETALYWEHLSERLPLPHISGKTVFCGHSPQISGEVADFGYLVCLDTYCCGTGWLTAMDVDSREIWQFDREGHQRRRSRLLNWRNPLQWHI